MKNFATFLQKPPFYHVEYPEPKHSLLQAHLQTRAWEYESSMPIIPDINTLKYTRVRLGNHSFEGWGQEGSSVEDLTHEVDPKSNHIHHAVMNSRLKYDLLNRTPNDVEPYQVRRIHQLYNPYVNIAYLKNSKSQIALVHKLDHNSTFYTKDLYAPQKSISDINHNGIHGFLREINGLPNNGY